MTATLAYRSGISLR